MPTYRTLPVDLDAARSLSQSCNLGVAAAQILIQRGIGNVAAATEYLDAKLSGLTSPEHMAGREEAAERISFAICNSERVVVFGDYDVDGTTSAAILADVLEALGGDARALVASRFEGGYGFSEAALERCLAERPGLIITCDCGSSDHERIARAKDLGVDVVVVDHHLVPDEPLPALAFLNPHRPECRFPYKGLASAGLALSLGAAIRARLDRPLDLRAWLDLVALGTVADVAPLDGDNRRLVRAGLARLRSASLRPGVRALMESARMKNRGSLGAHEIAFRLAPRLNAAGRLGDPSITLELLRCRDEHHARLLAARIESINNERKEVERVCTEQAIEQVLDVYGTEPSSGIVVASPDWNRGVVGITAARLVERFGVPAVVVAFEDGVGHGSARTPPGTDLYAAFSECREDLIKFGGHAAAAGLSILSARLAAFRAGFADACRGRSSSSTNVPVVDLELGNGFPIPSVSDLLRLEPLGEGNRQPLFAFPDVEITQRRAVGQGKHAKLDLRFETTRVSAFYPHQGPNIDSIPARATVLGYVHPDLFVGGDALEISVSGLVEPEHP